MVEGRKGMGIDFLSSQFHAEFSQKQLTGLYILQRADQVTLHNPGILKYLEAVMFV